MPAWSEIIGDTHPLSNGTVEAQIFTMCIKAVLCHTGDELCFKGLLYNNNQEHDVSLDKAHPPVSERLC